MGARRPGRNIACVGGGGSGTIDSMSRLTRRLLRVPEISTSTKETMFALLDEHYAGVSFAQFEEDLSEKDHVFTFWCGDELAGFSTIMRRRLPELSRAVFLFSGDTVIDKRFWGTQFLQVAFGEYVLLTKLKNPTRPVYWMLISKGYKTYMMMRRNYPYSFPRPTGPTPPDIQDVLERFYAGKFPGSFDRASGIIRLAEGTSFVKDAMAAPPEESNGDPDVAHFLKLNPGYGCGDELACLAEIRLRDYGPIFRKYFIKYLQSLRKHG